MSWTLTTSAAAVVKAGVHSNSTIIASGAVLAKWSDEAEGYVESQTRRTWVDNYAGLPTGIKGVLSDVTSSKIGMNIIAYDSTGYYTREADTLMNYNDEIVTKGLGVLKDFDSKALKTP
jgi:hypothetical protein